MKLKNYRMTYSKSFYVRVLVLLSFNFIAMNLCIAQNIAIVKEAETGTLGSDFSISVEVQATKGHFKSSEGIKVKKKINV